MILNLHLLVVIKAKKMPDVFSDSSDMCFRRGGLPLGVIPKQL